MKRHLVGIVIILICFKIILEQLWAFVSGKSDKPIL